MMFTVALIGADGAGKSTVGRRLQAALPMRSKTVYMGVNLEASRLLLPTTRLLIAIKRMRGRKPDMVRARPPGPTEPTRPQGPLGTAKSVVHSAVWVSEEWFRQLVAWSYTRRGIVVVFDRHFFADYYAHGVAERGADTPLARRMHAVVLDRWYPRPDMAVLLDAPAEVLHARKQEASVEWLEGRRREYLAMAGVLPNFSIVDATQPTDDVVSEVARLICEFYERQSRNGTQLTPTNGVK